MWIGKRAGSGNEAITIKIRNERDRVKRRREGEEKERGILKRKRVGGRRERR